MRDGWRAAVLGDVAVAASAGTFDPKSQAGAPYVGMEHLEPEHRAIAKWGSSDEAASSKTPFGPGDVLYGKLRPYLKKVALAESDGVCSTEIIVLRPRDTAVIPAFLYYLCASPSLLSYSIDHSAGTRMPRISPTLLLKASISLPPIEEQRRIADILLAADSVICVLGDELKAAEEWYTASLETRLQNESTCIRLGDVIRSLENGISPRCLERTPSHEEFGVLKVSAVSVRCFDEDSVKTLPPGVAPDVRKQVRAGDLLVTRASGAIRRVGVCCHVAKEPAHRLLLSDLIFRVGIDETVLLPAFAALALSTTEVRNQVEQRAVGSSTMKKVNQGILRSLGVRVPDLHQQSRLVDDFDVFSTWASAKRQEIDRLGALRSALAAALLSGTHEIPESYDRLLAEVA